MGFVMTITAGLVVWIVLLGDSATKRLRRFVIAAAVILIGAAVKVLSGYLPSRRS